MFISINKLANQLPKDKPDNRAANALQEGLGGQFGEMRTMMQYLFQNFNFRGKAKPYQDLIKSVAGEEIGHVELISTTINMLLEGQLKMLLQTNFPYLLLWMQQTYITS